VTILKRLVTPFTVIAALTGGLALTAAQDAAATTATPTMSLESSACNQVVSSGVLISYCDAVVQVNGDDVADIEWGFAYQKANNHLRAWTSMGWTSGYHAQVDKLNLGDRNHILKSVGPVNNPTSPVQTAAVSCHAAGYYNSNNHFSLRTPPNLGSVVLRGQTGEGIWHLGTQICGHY
jgi:hypothetical protein